MALVVDWWLTTTHGKRDEGPGAPPRSRVSRVELCCSASAKATAPKGPISFTGEEDSGDGWGRPWRRTGGG